MNTTETDNTLLNSLESKGQVELLNDIDRLRSQGLSHFDVSLPQIIVCGDQSSGKSSVLEALSRVQFPTKDELCTRFATEVVLRKAAVEYACVNIIPGKSCNDEERKRLSNSSPPTRLWNSSRIWSTQHRLRSFHRNPVPLATTCYVLRYLVRIYPN